jgi:hypothetical protein
MRFIYLGVVVWVLLTVFTTVFAASSKPQDVRVLSKTWWIVLCLFLPIFGSILYITIGRPISSPEPKTVAPDDDPEFLRHLAERLRNENKKDEDGENPNG